jgi:hypothetical protein
MKSRNAVTARRLWNSGLRRNILLWSENVGSLSVLNKGWRWQKYLFIYRTYDFVTFEVIMAVTINSTICNLIKRYWCFRRTYCFHLQGRRLCQASGRQPPTDYCTLARTIQRPRIWRQYNAPKRPHGFKFQKTVFLTYDLLNHTVSIPDNTPSPSA